MKEITFRKLRENDLERIMDIERQSFALPWSMESMRNELKNNIARYIVAVHDGRVIGYGGMWLIIDEAYITNIAVDQNARRMHVGERLMRLLMQIALQERITRMTLEVRVSNRAAIAMYDKLGFTCFGTRKRYYSDNQEDAHIMWNDDLARSDDENTAGRRI
ncbi:MAG: ribosomal protein S18-alanine N-acetyltransferase [Christensenellales bacterium]|jgi:ribosomal-protein-alanine N-acetyltransferase